MSAKVRPQYVLVWPTTTTAARFGRKQHRHFLVCSSSLLLEKRMRGKAYARLNYSCCCCCCCDCCLQSKSRIHAQHYMLMMMMKSNGTNNVPVCIERKRKRITNNKDGLGQVFFYHKYKDSRHYQLI